MAKPAALPENSKTLQGPSWALLLLPSKLGKAMIQNLAISPNFLERELVVNVLLNVGEQHLQVCGGQKR